jgi:hypothetical protein
MVGRVRVREISNDEGQRPAADGAAVVGVS